MIPNPLREEQAISELGSGVITIPENLFQSETTPNQKAGTLNFATFKVPLPGPPGYLTGWELKSVTLPWALQVALASGTFTSVGARLQIDLLVGGLAQASLNTQAEPLQVAGASAGFCLAQGSWVEDFDNPIPLLRGERIELNCTYDFRGNNAGAEVESAQRTLQLGVINGQFTAGALVATYKPGQIRYTVRRLPNAREM